MLRSTSVQDQQVDVGQLRQSCAAASVSMGHCELFQEGAGFADVGFVTMSIMQEER